MDNVPYSVYEAAQARSDKRFRQMLSVILVLIFLLMATNTIWIVYESQFQKMKSITQTVSQDGTANQNYFVGE